MNDPNIEANSPPTPIPEICQYLGMQHDRATYSNYPSNWNACYRCQPRANPSLEHQSQFCLTKFYENCPVFTSNGDLKMPKKLRIKPDISSWEKYHVIFLAGIIILVAIIVLLFLIPRVDRPIEPTKLPTSVPTQVLQTLIVTETAVATLEPTPSGVPTNSQTATPTPESTQDLSTETEPISYPTHTQNLDQPIGGEVKYIIHRVAEGESVQQYAELYNTNAEAIYNSNYLLPVPIWINWLIIIPIDQQDVSGLPVFEAYLVESDMITLEKVAESLSVNAAVLAKYNDLPIETTLRIGDWLIIPRERQMFP